jgi:hypothetical protein
VLHAKALHDNPLTATLSILRTLDKFNGARR